MSSPAVDAAHDKGGEFGAVQKVHGQELPRGGRLELRVHQRNNIPDLHEKYLCHISLAASFNFFNHGEGGEHGAVQEVHGRELSCWGRL